MMDSVSIVMLRATLRVLKKNLLKHTVTELNKYQEEHPDQILERNKLGKIKIGKESYRIDHNLSRSISIVTLLLHRLKLEEEGEESAFSRNWNSVRKVFIENSDLNLDLEFLDQEEIFDMKLADEFASKFVEIYPCKNSKDLKKMTDQYKNLKDEESKRILINEIKTFLKLLWIDVRIFANVHP